jgi:hypothetical protein
MGIFQTEVEVRNLAPVSLTVRFDGQEKNIPPGVSRLPDMVVQYAMNQNPIMGTQDPNNPHISGAQYLIVPVGSHYDREPLTKEEWETHLNRPCRVDEQALFEEKYSTDPKARLVTYGKGKKTVAKSRYEKDVAQLRTDSAFDNR